MNLNQLLKLYGEPKILIDNWDENNKGFACYEFDEDLIWDQSGLYLSGKKISANFINLQKIINFTFRLAFISCTYLYDGTSYCFVAYTNLLKGTTLYDVNFFKFNTYKCIINFNDPRKNYNLLK